jgi:UDP:flavonoid glycosyltransferase YjiC (YdhE family)
MAEKIKFIFVPLGSSGDVNPMVWLARLMAAREHDVVVVIQAGMIEHARRANLNGVSTGSKEQQESVVRNPAVWHPLWGFEVLAQHFAGWAREMLPAIVAEIVPGRTVLVGAGIAFAARIAAEVRHVPLVTAQLQPAIFSSAYDMPVFMRGFEAVKRWPMWLRRVVMWLSHHQVDRILARPVNRLRAEWGLRTRARGILHSWACSPDLVLGLFPEWYAAPQPDWPPQTVLTRFPLYDETAERPVPPEAEAFLTAGPAPILLTPGSLNAHARQFFAAGVEACRLLHRRALLVTAFKEHLPVQLTDGTAHFDFLPFSRVFPRCSAVMHHGGIGTCAQAMSAGVPQLIMAMAHDQPDNAWRTRQLQVGDYLYPGRFHAAEVARRLERLLQSTQVTDACRRTRDRIAGQMPPDAVADLLERFAERTLNEEHRKNESHGSRRSIVR